MNEYEVLLNLYKSITSVHDIKPNRYFSISGSINLSGNIKAAVYSDDHGLHFHVIYLPDKIDARFSWPSIEIESYKSKNEFKSKQVRNIQTMCRNREVQLFLQHQFEKRYL